MKIPLPSFSFAPWSKILITTVYANPAQVVFPEVPYTRSMTFSEWKVSTRLESRVPGRQLFAVELDGNCLERIGLEDKEVIWCRELRAEDFEVRDDKLLCNGVVLNSNHCFVLRFSQNNSLNAKNNFKARQFHSFRLEGGRIFITSLKHGPNGPEDAEHPASEMIGICSYSITDQRILNG